METINHQSYVSFEIANLLKEAGFDWEVNTCRYNSSPDKVSSNGTLTSNFNGYAFQHIAVSAPTLDIAQRWLREVKDIEVNVLCVYIKHIKKYSYTIFTNEYKHEIIDEGFDTHEEALEAGVKKALEIINKGE